MGAGRETLTGAWAERCDQKESFTRGVAYVIKGMAKKNQANRLLHGLLVSMLPEMLKGARTQASNLIQG